MHIFVDGDGCPVVFETVLAAKAHGVPCTIVCDTAHVIRSDYAAVVTVAKGADKADFELVRRISKGDIAVTQDHGVAAMCLAKGAHALNQNGVEYTPDNIDAMLFSRYLTKKAKQAGARMRGPQKRTAEQDKAFCLALEKMIKAAL